MTVSITELQKAWTSLNEALRLPKTDITRDASIQRFEFTLELAWKTAKRKMGSASAAPKVIAREMAQAGLIDDPARWVDFIEARNLSSHTYREETAEKVFAQAVLFAIDCEELIKRLGTLP